MQSNLGNQSLVPSECCTNVAGPQEGTPRAAFHRLQAPVIWEGFFFSTFISANPLCLLSSTEYVKVPRRWDMVSSSLHHLPALKDSENEGTHVPKMWKPGSAPFLEKQDACKAEVSGVFGGGDCPSTGCMDNGRVMRKRSIPWFSVPNTEAWNTT